MFPLNPTFLLLAASPWSPSEWTINLDIGRERGTNMPSEWGASGARLCLPIPVLIDSERSDFTDNFFGNGKSFELNILENPTFISMEGEQTVRFEDTGAWKISLRKGGKLGDANKIRMYLDVSSFGKKNQVGGNNDDIIVAQRNDVTLLAKERLYLIANCWRETSELKNGLDRFRSSQARLDAAQARVDSQLSHETGDRRLDGIDPLDTTMANIDMSFLIRKRDDALLTYREAEENLPNEKKLSPPGGWPGTTDQLVIGPGKIAVKRKKGFWSTEEFDIIGTWTATPEENGEFEYYEEEDEEESQQQSVDRF